MKLFIWGFVFQAEDGIRDRSPSRGLGDVYKRQVLPIVELIARTQPQRRVIVAHADRTAQDHALRDTVLHVGRQIDDFTAYTWYESVDASDHRSQQGLMDLSEVPLPDDLQVFTCG